MEPGRSDREELRGLADVLRLVHPLQANVILFTVSEDEDVFGTGLVLTSLAAALHGRAL
jgi:hypothetical protein